MHLCKHFKNIKFSKVKYIKANINNDNININWKDRIVGQQLSPNKWTANHEKPSC